MVNNMKKRTNNKGVSFINKLLICTIIFLVMAIISKTNTYYKPFTLFFQGFLRHLSFIGANRPDNDNSDNGEIIIDKNNQDFYNKYIYFNNKGDGANGEKLQILRNAS